MNVRWCWQILLHLDSVTLIVDGSGELRFGAFSIFRIFFLPGHCSQPPFRFVSPCPPFNFSSAAFCFLGSLPPSGSCLFQPSGWITLTTCGLFQHFSPILIRSSLVIRSYVWCLIFSPGFMFFLPAWGFTLAKCQLLVVFQFLFHVGQLFAVAHPLAGLVLNIAVEKASCVSMNEIENCVFCTLL